MPYDITYMWTLNYGTNEPIYTVNQLYFNFKKTYKREGEEKNAAGSKGGQDGILDRSVSSGLQKTCVQTLAQLLSAV